MQIAAIALVHNLIVVTHNIRKFGRIAGLQIEDWEVPEPTMPARYPYHGTVKRARSAVRGEIGTQPL